MPDAKSRFKKLTSLSTWTLGGLSPNRGAPAPSSASTTSGTPDGLALKKVVQGEAWESPFRGGNAEDEKAKVNLHQQFKELNKLDAIQVPERFRNRGYQNIKGAKKPTAAKKDGTTTEEAAPKTAAADAGDAAVDADDVQLERPLTDAELEAKDAAETDAADVDATQPVAIAELTESAEPADTADDSVVPDSEEAKLEELAEDPKVEKHINKAAAAEVKAEDAEEKAEELAAEREKLVTDLGAAGEAVNVEGDATDGIEQRIKEEPPTDGLHVDPADKFTKIESDANLEQFKDQPALLQRYMELQQQGILLSTRTADDPDAMIDLGGGLKMKQQDLMDMAAKRVAPVLANINDAVGKTREEDESRRQLDLSNKQKGHEQSLRLDFAKFTKKLEGKKSKHKAKTDEQKENIARMKRGVEARGATFAEQTKKEMEQAQKDYEEREAKAVEKHEKDKETIEKNHEELVETKKQELEAAKTKQSEVTQEIEELQEAKTGFADENLELQTRLEELQKEAEDEQVKLDALIKEHDDEQEAIATKKERITTLNDEVTALDKEIADKETTRDGLKEAIAALAVLINGYSDKLAKLQNDKEARAIRLDDAKAKNSEWQQEKAAVAAEVAKQHERERLEASQQAETEKHRKDLAFQQLQEDEARAEEKERLLRLKQEREDAERARNEAEHKRQQRIAEREEEAKRLEEAKQKQNTEYLDVEQQRQREVDELQKEIESLKQQQSERALAARGEAQRIAEEKEQELVRLKQERERNQKLYQLKLELEELQKKRLDEEGTHLARIAELQQQKRQLAEDDVDGTGNAKFYPPELQQLIEEREAEIKKLEREIDDDDDELSGKGKPVTKQLEASQAVDPAAEKKKLLKLWGADRAGAGAAAGAAALGAAGAGAGVAAASSGSHAAPAAPAPQAKQAKQAAPSQPRPKAPEKSSSWNRFKSKFSSKDDGKQAPVRTASSAAKQRSMSQSATPNDAVVPAVPAGALARKQSSAISTASLGEYDTFSVYEEVTSEEFERHKNDPDYIQVTAEEFERHNHKPLDGHAH